MEERDEMDDVEDRCMTPRLEAGLSVLKGFDCRRLLSVLDLIQPPQPPQKRILENQPTHRCWSVAGGFEGAVFAEFDQRLPRGRRDDYSMFLHKPFDLGEPHFHPRPEF